jgi:hypothetical protein
MQSLTASNFGGGRAMLSEPPGHVALCTEPVKAYGPSVAEIRRTPRSGPAG